MAFDWSCCTQFFLKCSCKNDWSKLSLKFPLISHVWLKFSFVLSLLLANSIKEQLEQSMLFDWHFSTLHWFIGLPRFFTGLEIAAFIGRPFWIDEPINFCDRWLFIIFDRLSMAFCFVRATTFFVLAGSMKVFVICMFPSSSHVPHSSNCRLL